MSDTLLESQTRVIKQSSCGEFDLDKAQEEPAGDEDALSSTAAKKQAQGKATKQQTVEAPMGQAKSPLGYAERSKGLSISKISSRDPELSNGRERESSQGRNSQGLNLILKSRDSRSKAQPEIKQTKTADSFYKSKGNTIDKMGNEEGRRKGSNIGNGSSLPFAAYSHLGNSNQKEHEIEARGRANSMNLTGAAPVNAPIGPSVGQIKARERQQSHSIAFKGRYPGQGYQEIASPTNLNGNSFQRQQALGQGSSMNVRSSGRKQHADVAGNGQIFNNGQGDQDPYLEQQLGLLDGISRQDHDEIFSQKQPYDNFNSNIVRQQSQNMSGQNMHLSQGGGGFARGTIFKSGKEWRIGGMAANAKTQPMSATTHKQKRQTLPAGSLRANMLVQQNQIQSNPNAQQMLQKPKASDAGSRMSFATNGRGLPRTLWQKGAIFSNQQSRASISAGLAIPHYQGATQANLNQALNMGQGLSSYHLGGTANTNGFYHQQYAQMTQKINEDIEQQPHQSLKIQTNQSESGAYGANHVNREIAKYQQDNLMLISNNMDNQSPLNNFLDRNLASAQKQTFQAGRGAHQQDDLLNNNYSELEFGNSIFKNRPFSSENKYGNIKRHHPRITINVNNDNINDADVEGPAKTVYNQVDNKYSNQIDHDKPFSEPRSAVPLIGNKDMVGANQDFILPPINNQPNIGKLITDEIDYFKIDHLGQQQLDIDISRSASGGQLASLRGTQDANGLAALINKGYQENQMTAYEKKEARMLQQRVPEIVWLRVYHVTSLNKYLLEWLGFGFYHSSIELYNHEFAYGGHDYDFSGIVCVESLDSNAKDPEKIKQQAAASGGLELKERIPIGITYYSMDEVDDIVIYFGNFWHGQDYDPFAQNCNSFAQKFVSHICDKEQFYYPSYINRFTKLGSILRGWFKPLQILLGEVVDLNQNVENNDDDWDYEIADDYMPVVGVSQKNKQVEPGNKVVPEPEKKQKENEYTIHQSQPFQINQPSYNNSPRPLSPILKSPKILLEGQNEDQLLNITEKKQKKLDALLCSPKQNILVSQIIDITQRDPNINDGTHRLQQPHAIQYERSSQTSGAPAAADQKPEPPTSAINAKEEPVENIKEKADELFNKSQFQQAMSFYEICLGKIYSITNVDLNEDAYMMNLTIHIYLGICDCAIKLGLWEHLCHFATQCIDVDKQNTQEQLHLIYHRRSQGLYNQGRAEQAQKDLEAALDMIKNYENHKDTDNQVIQKALDDLKEKLKPPSAPARAAGGQEQELSQSHSQYKDALDRLQDDIHSQTSGQQHTKVDQDAAQDERFEEELLLRPQTSPKDSVRFIGQHTDLRSPNPGSEVAGSEQLLIQQPAVEVGHGHLKSNSGVIHYRQTITADGARSNQHSGSEQATSLGNQKRKQTGSPGRRSGSNTNNNTHSRQASRKSQNQSQVAGVKLGDRSDVRPGGHSHTADRPQEKEGGVEKENIQKENIYEQ